MLAVRVAFLEQDSLPQPRPRKFAASSQLQELRPGAARLRLARSRWLQPQSAFRSADPSSSMRVSRQLERDRRKYQQLWPLHRALNEWQLHGYRYCGERRRDRDSDSHSHWPADVHSAINGAYVLDDHDDGEHASHPKLYRLEPWHRRGDANYLCLRDGLLHHR
jgi:hypothetical protein